MKKILLALTLLASFAFHAHGGEVFHIRNASDWHTFAVMVNDATNRYDVDAVLDADITTSEHVGVTRGAYYRGTFNGNGHTLTFNKNWSSGRFIAPFCHVGNATIKNLHTTGTIESREMYPAGIVAEVYNGSATIEGCISSVTLKGTMNGEGTLAGLVGRVSSGSVVISNCKFDGSFEGANCYGNGGFVSWVDEVSSAVIQDCLFAPDHLNTRFDACRTWARQDNRGTVTVTNSYATKEYSIFVIRSSDDWDRYRAMIDAAKGEHWVDASLEADISIVNTAAMNSDAPLHGTFYGNGHTITVNINGSYQNYISLFRYGRNFTICDLNVKGTIKGNNYISSIVGKAEGVDAANKITNCRVSTEIEADNRVGGFIGYGNADIVNCLFDGKLTCNAFIGGHAAAFVNVEDYSVRCALQNCLDKGSYRAVTSALNLYGHSGYEWGNDYNQWTYNNWSYNNLKGADRVGNKSAGEMVTQLGSGWKLDGDMAVPKVSNSLSANRWYNGSMTASEMVAALGQDNWEVVNGKAVPVMTNSCTFLSSGSSSGRTLGSGTYYVTNDVTFTNGACQNGLNIAPGATVHIHVARGATLTARGGDASGRTGAGAGILLPQSSTLFLDGGGRVIATGGNAANGNNGTGGGNGEWNGNRDRLYAGNGGYGGNGGGGAGAGIGTRGADGGSGGSGGVMNWDSSSWSDHVGPPGNEGTQGSSALSMGTLYVNNFSGITLNATGGKAGANGSGGPRGKNGFYDGYHNYTTSGGGGGGGGGAGGQAYGIGTGGAGGGGGGGGSCGTTKWTHNSTGGYYYAGAKGGIGGQHGDGGKAPDGAESCIQNVHTDCENKYEVSGSYKNHGWYKGDDRAAGGDGGSSGVKAISLPIDNNCFFAQFNAVSKFGGAVEKFYTVGYKSNTNTGKVTITVPSVNEMEMIERDRYLIQWNDKQNGTGTNYKANDKIQIGEGYHNFYGEWKSYKDIFPAGSGTRLQPFMIESGELLELADYVNNGGNTRGLYFKQKGNIVLQDILSRYSRGDKWTPIGHTYIFEGDYDGGGYMIRSGQIDNVGSYIGIFGQVSGSIHNLGVEKITIETNDQSSRCGAIAGLLLGSRAEQPGQPGIPTSGMMKHCYAANNTVKAVYAGGLVGEMQENTSMSHCHETGCYLGTNKWGGLASIIHSNAKLDACFTASKHSGNGYSGATNSPIVSESQKTSGEMAWLLNDKTAFGVTWYQNIDKGAKDAYPVLDSIRGRVFFDGTKYSNEAIGTLFALSGKGLPEDPFLITSLSDLEKVQNFCNEGSKITGIHFLQTVDIDLNGSDWTPIGNSGSKAFDGHYDGGGHIIRNGKIGTGDYAGIFGVVAGTVTRLGVEKMTITSMQRSTRVGGIAGRLQGDGVISNCYVKNSTVTSDKNNKGVAGAIVGDMQDYAAVRNSYGYQNTVIGASAGYIVGEMPSQNTQLYRCYTDGSSLIGSYAYGTTPKSEPGVSTNSFRSGMYAYLLNDENDANPEPVWYQNLTEDTDHDETPVLSSSHAMVSKRNGGYTNDSFNLAKLGDGTKENPFKIATAEDLQNLIKTIGRVKRTDGYILQTADIDMKDLQIVPIGTGTDGFEGYYDGGGHVIKNVNMLTYKNKSMGLFNNIKGVVENLGIENSTFQATGTVDRVGAFAGRMSGNGVLRNCYVKESTIDFNLTSGVVVGALVGEQTDASRIESCYGYKNTVTGQNDGLDYFGHIVGYIGSAAKDSLVFTDGAKLCADKQPGADNMLRSEKGVTDLRFNSGEVCYLLNGAKKDKPVWGQTIRKDATPAFTASQDTHKRVYRYTNDYQALYTNTDEVPYSVLVSLNPNHDKKGAQTFEIFKADENYYIPDLLLEKHAPEWQNYYFAGWTTQANGKGTFYPRDGKVAAPKENIQLYALWDIKVPLRNESDKWPTVVLDNLRPDTIRYKVYDYGGYKTPYGNNYKGKVTLQAPEEHVIRLSGTITTEGLRDNNPCDTLVVYDGDGKKKIKLTNEFAKSGDTYKDVFFSTTDGAKEDIGKLMSSGREMTIEFVTNSENNFEGLDLLVTVLPQEIRELGQGSKDDPFLVGSVQDLQTVNNYMSTTKDSEIYIEQTTDIDMAGETFTPMASGVENFKGHYDGGGYVIRNGKIKAPQYAGFFSVVTGKVTRLGMENMTVNYENRDGRSGAIAASMIGNGEISYCYVKGCTVTNNGIQGYEGQGVAGAIVSEMYDQAVIKNCYSYQNKVTATRAAQICADTKVGTQISLCFTDGDNLISQKDATVTSSETGVKAERFFSGELCYQLNGALRDSVIWRQTIGTDSLPVLNKKSKRVYFFNEQGASGYTNETTATALDLKLMDIVDDANVGYKVLKGILVYAAEVVPEHRHFVFKGWNTQPDGSGDFYPKDTMFVYSKELSLYAQYDMVVVMSKDDTEKISQEMPKYIPFAKVYDDGDKDGPYTAGARYVTLIAPEGRVLQLKGTMASKTTTDDSAPQDYLAVYDGNYAADLKNSQKLANDSAKTGEGWRHVYYSTKAGELYNIGTLSSSGREMTIFFQTTDQGKDAFKGIDLTVTQVPVDSAVSVLGKGTEEAPYRVTTAADLKNLAAYSNLKSNSKFSILQTDDIDMEGLTVAPLLNDSAGFAGHYDGCGYVIRNMKMDHYKGTSVGLFGSVSGIVERVGMENCTVKAVANDARTGALAGQLVGNGLLRNCYVVGSTVSYNDVVGVTGALVGEQKGNSRIEKVHGYKNEVIGFTDRGGNKRYGYIVGDMAATATQDLVFTDGTTFCSDNQGGTFTNANKEVTKDRFASGEICYLLNESRSDSIVWYQTLGTDSVPVLRANHGVVTYNDGKYSNFFYVYTKEDFIAYADQDADMYLAQDIDLGEWNREIEFSGNLDGGGHTIKYSGNSNSIGLFDVIRQNASVKHLRVEANILTMRDCGGIARSNYGTISDCHFRGNITRHNVVTTQEGYVGGITTILDGGTIDHCSATGKLTTNSPKGSIYPISPVAETVQDYWTWVDPTNSDLYAAQADSAMKVRADYSVYAKGILDVTGPYLVLGNDSITARGGHLSSLTLTDGKRFDCPAVVTVDEITYRRHGTNGAYEPWVLPFDYTIDANMIKNGMEFYRFEKDSTSNSNILMKQISADESYQVAANEPLAFRTTGNSQYNFGMKLIKDGKSQPLTIRMPSGGVGAQIANTKDMARVVVTYDSIAPARITKELMYVWNNDKQDFVLGDSTTQLLPFRYYLQYIDKPTGNYEQWEQTDWARRQAKAAAQKALSRKQTTMRAPLSAMVADGWQPIILDPRGSQTITAQMLEDYEILALNDIYDAEDPADPDRQRMTVAVIYEQMVEGVTLPTAVPLLVKPRRAGVEPLVTEQMGQEIDALLTAAEQEMSEDEVVDAFNEIHYWCSTFSGRYDVWQMPLPEPNSVLNEFGALVFADTGDDQYFYRIGAADGGSMKAMSYCFTACDSRTLENLPLANDRIEIVTVGYVEATGIEDVRSEKADVRGDVYNLRGQRVNDSYRGIVIKNGKKILKR